jgi:hypothetical protein
MTYVTPFACGPLGAASGANALNILGPLNVALVDTLVALNARIATMPNTAGQVQLTQIKGQLQTAATTLNNVIDGPFRRLYAKAVAGDVDALQRAVGVGTKTLDGMKEIIQELDYGQQKNWEQFRGEFLRDVSVKIQQLVNTAGQTLGAAVPWWLWVVAGTAGVVYVMRTFK